jgi:hypothetical protein
MAAEMLRDLIDIPDRVLAGDFVLNLSKGVGEESTVTEYVVTEQLADCFDQALGIIQSAVSSRVSRAAYLDGSFGSGKSHFMAVLHAVLRGDPAARGKAGLAEVVARHDGWLAGRSFLLVPYHMIDSTSLESAVLGGYVAHVRRLFPGRPLPVVYRDDMLLADAQDLRATLGDDRFLAGLPADDEWGGASWDAASLDAALTAPPGARERARLVGDLLTTHFQRYADAVAGTAGSFIELDKGLAEISRHARDVLGMDAVVLLLDELVLWLSSYIGDPTRIKAEAQKVSKLVESAEHERPAPIVSFLPRQRDLRELVGQDTAGATTASLFDTLKYWDGRLDVIKLADSNLPAIVAARLLQPRDDAARQALDTAFEQAERTRPEVWEALLDAQGGAGSRADFRATYPFSPAFLHAMVDVSSALQRERTALKLMQQLLVDYRDTLPVGQLMPLGAIYDVLARGGDRPFSDKLRDEFEQAKRFYQRVREYLMRRHALTGEQAARLPPRHAFRADDLVVKTLLLAALVPNVPALRALTATRLAALNHGSVAAMIPGQEQRTVVATLRGLAGEFGEIRVSDADNPAVEINLIGVNTGEILQQVIHVDDDAARRRLLRALLWEDLGITDRGEFTTTRPFIWRGTDRIAELVFANVRDLDLADGQFEPELPGALRVIVDYPFDEGSFGPAEDRHRVQALRGRLRRADTMVWLPSFLSGDRLADLGDLVRIRYVLEDRGRLDELTPYLPAEERHHARSVLESRRSALTTKLREALRRAYGLAQPDAADLGAAAEEHLMALDSQLQVRPPAGLGFADALSRVCGQMLDYAYPRHPDFDPAGRRQVIRLAELRTVLSAVERAAQDKAGRLEVPQSDLQVLRRIAGPLEIADVDEVLVLREDWKLRIERQAAAAGSVTDLRVGDIHRWIEAEQPGLPALAADLLVCCFAVQSDRAWMRGGQSAAAPPELGKLTPDMVLRRQDLPDPDEFADAADRAAAIFEVARPPVRSARAVQALAGEVRRAAGAALPAAESLAAELDRHAATLGLAADTPRLVTARTAAALLNRLVGLSDATALLRALAQASLPRDGVIYRASLASSRLLADRIAALDWPVLDRAAELAGQGAPGSERAEVLIAELRGAAGRDEHESRLGAALETARSAATRLLLDMAAHGTTAPGGAADPGAVTRLNRSAGLPGSTATSTGGPGAETTVTRTPGGPAAPGLPGPAPVRQILLGTRGEPGAAVGSGDQASDRPGAGLAGDADAAEVRGGLPDPGARQIVAQAGDIGGVTDELRRFASEHPGATVEVTWRIVTPQP